MFAFNKKTGAKIVGTLESLSATSDTDDDSFRFKNGELCYDHAGETEVHWDSQETVTGPKGVVFVDEEGAEVTQDDIELREQEGESE